MYKIIWWNYSSYYIKFFFEVILYNSILVSYVIEPSPRQSTEFRVPMYWASPSKVLCIGTSKILSSFTDIGTTFGTDSSMFTE